MIFAAQSNQGETADQIDFLEAHFGSDVLRAMHKEIQNDNDFIRIQKIMSYVDTQIFPSGYHSGSEYDFKIKFIKGKILISPQNPQLNNSSDFPSIIPLFFLNIFLSVMDSKYIKWH